MSVALSCMRWPLGAFKQKRPLVACPLSHASISVRRPSAMMSATLSYSCCFLAPTSSSTADSPSQAFHFFWSHS
eukprot:206971-Rhodomonas_salina.1